GAALAEDVRFLHQLLRTTYSGWPELLAHRTFDPDAFFTDWSASPPSTTTARSGRSSPSCRGPSSWSRSASG
ncbi:hypothetical protein, partial [Corallococcus carmarthensis]|uniref:hypothetical protein n=1 Tax=Corallococcus carmarthensis TaxID=2316728 RepID=UPI00148B8391